MPFDLGRSWAKIYGRSVGWLKNKSGLKTKACQRNLSSIGRNQNSLNTLESGINVHP